MRTAVLYNGINSGQFDSVSWTGLLSILVTTWLSAKLSLEGDPAALEPAWPDQNQW